MLQLACPKNLEHPKVAAELTGLLSVDTNDMTKCISAPAMRFATLWTLLIHRVFLYRSLSQVCDLQHQDDALDLCDHRSNLQINGIGDVQGNTKARSIYMLISLKSTLIEAPEHWWDRSFEQAFGGFIRRAQSKHCDMYDQNIPL